MTTTAASVNWQQGLPDSLRSSLAGPKIPCLDGMRGIAAWSVVFYHMKFPFGLGSQAVEFFFVLSGFLITWLLLVEEDRRGVVSLRDFYIRRSLRIFPPFYVYWLVSLLVMIAAKWPIPWGVMWSAFFYVSNWYHAIHGAPSSPVSHCWSLGLEEQYYLLWPAAFVALRYFHRSRTIWVGAMVVLVWARRTQCLMQEGSGDYVYHALDTRADHVLVGTWTALAIHGGALRPLCRLFALSSWLIIPTLALLLLQFSQDHLEDWRGLMGVGAIIEPVLFMALVLQLLCHPNAAGVRWLNSAPMLHLGALSYSTYLWHQLPVGGARYKLANLDPLVRNTITLAAVAFLAHASYYLVERPSLRLKDRIMERRRTSSAALPAPAASHGPASGIGGN